MNKTQIWDNVVELLRNENVEVESNLYKDLSKLLEPKKGGSSGHEPIYNDEGEIIELYCNWFKEYRPIKDFKISTKAKTGRHYECKDAEVIWQGYAREIKALKAQIAALLDDVLDGKITADEAKDEKDELQSRIDQLEADRANKVTR